MSGMEEEGEDVRLYRHGRSCFARLGYRAIACASMVLGSFSCAPLPSPLCMRFNPASRDSEKEHLQLLRRCHNLFFNPLTGGCFRSRASTRV